MSGLPLASLGDQFNWEPSERPSGTLPGIVSLRVGKQEILSTNSQPFLGEGCSWALIPQHSGPALHVAGKTLALQKVLMQRDRSCWLAWKLCR